MSTRVRITWTPEAWKAIQHALPLGDLTRGGRLHVETRTDRRGRTERRYVKPPQADHGGQLPLLVEAANYKIDLGAYFASGSNHAGEIAGFADLGINPGVTAPEMNAEAIHAAMQLRGRRAKDGRLLRLFLDSGAFGEIEFTATGPRDKKPITDAEWGRRLDVYERLAEALGPQLYAVAPDKVADQEETLRRLRTYAPRVKKIRALGARILVPVQKGARTMAAFAEEVDAILGPGTWTPAIPMKKDATSDADLRAFLQARRPTTIHLLGVGPKSRRFPDMERIVGEASPHTHVTLDSVAITAAVGRPEGGTPRKLTAAQDKVREEVAESAFAANDPDLADYTDAILFPSGWTTATERRRIAAEMKLDPQASAAFVSDPEGWLLEESDGEGSNKNYEVPEVDEAMDAAWHRFYVGSGSTTERKRRAIRQAFTGHMDARREAMKAAQLDLFDDPSHGGQLQTERHTDRLGRTETRHVRRPPPPSLHERFGEQGAPKPGERGHREISPARADAEGRVDQFFRRVASIYDGGDAHRIEHALQAAGHEVHDWAPETSEPDPDDFELDDLPDLLGMPEWHPEDAADAAMLVARSTERGGEIPGAIVREILADAIAPAGKLRLVNVPTDEAREFIAKHHSQMPEMNPRGLMYAIGAMKGGRLVAVATAGSPTGRWGGQRVDPKNILELTRVASDGSTLGASSFLTSRLLDLLPRSRRGDPHAPALFVTYSLTSEEGTTYKALRDKGLRPVAMVKGKAQGGGGARAGNALGYAEPDKIRWEAGDAADAARWDLVETGAPRLQQPRVSR